MYESIQIAFININKLVSWLGMQMSVGMSNIKIAILTQLQKIIEGVAFVAQVFPGFGAAIDGVKKNISNMIETEKLKKNFAVLNDGAKHASLSLDIQTNKTKDLNN